jgi:hypothetical protein
MIDTRKSVLWLVLLGLLAGWTTGPAAAQEVEKKESQWTFSSPVEAIEALVVAVRDNNDQRLVDIFGPGSEKLITSGDPVADRDGRARFLKSYGESNSLEIKDDRRMVLLIGSHAFPFPIPLVRGEKGWYFDTPAGAEEILKRRIGRNELHTIDVLEAYTSAQREYACRSSRGGAVAQFAQKLISSPGTHDGLYWPAGEDEEESPFGPLIAKATKAGYNGSLGEVEPFHGYFFKVLTAQGSHAEGGAFDYLVNGNMVLGFGMVAYPAVYGSSGIKTFIVNQEGVIYEKDLGDKTAEAANMTTFDPDSSWQKTSQSDE